MQPRRSRGRLALGIVLALMGALWTLQGFDIFGQDGGMNGQREWIVVGAVAVVVGVILVYISLRARPQP